jgi:Integral membrane protein TerC family
MRFICCAFLLLFPVLLTNGYQFASQSLQLRKSYTSTAKLHRPITAQLKDDINISVEEGFDVASELRKTGLWVAAAAGFAGVIGATKGVDSAVEFCSGYLLEQCLSVDNLFVFIVLFEYFKVDKDKQDRVLSYGIWGGKIKVMILTMNCFRLPHDG